MRGLWKQDDPKFNTFFTLLQEVADTKGIVFFSQGGDGREIETDNIKGEDLMGWLIPKEKADEFEPLWNEHHNSTDMGVWDDFFGFAEWKIVNNNLDFDFATYKPEDNFKRKVL